MENKQAHLTDLAPAIPPLGQRTEPSDAGLSSVDNALVLLRLVGQRDTMRVASAAEELGVARSTAHRLLVALKNRGFVSQDKPNGAYRAGRALDEIGLAAVRRTTVQRIARPVLEQLSRSTRETASLLFLEGNRVRFIDCVEGQRSVRAGGRAGQVLPAHCTAGGKALLSALPEADLARRYPGGQLEARTPNSIASWELLRAEIAHIREAGYAANVGENENGVSAVGVAVDEPGGAPLAGIALAIPTSRMAAAADGEPFAPLLRQAQAEITQSLRAGLYGKCLFLPPSY